MVVKKAAERKKYLKFKKVYLFKKYIIVNNKKNLNNNIDLILPNELLHNLLYIEILQNLYLLK